MEPWLIVGAGRLGLQLARVLYQHHVSFFGVVCHSLESRTNAAQVLPQRLLLESHRPLPPATRVILAVRDAQIAEVGMALAPRLPSGAIILHCSGAFGPSVLDSLAGAGFATGVFHPLLPFPHPIEPVVDFRGAVVTLAGHPTAVAAGHELAEATGMVPVHAPTLSWPLYHAAATLAAPLVHALLQAAQEELRRAGFPAEHISLALRKLAATVVEQATGGHGWNLLTGPLVRNDYGTIHAHENVLQPEVKAVYQALTAFVSARLRGEVFPQQNPETEDL